MEVRGPSFVRAAAGEALLRELPDWFGIEESLLQYARELPSLPCFTIEGDDRLDGLLSVRQHFPDAAEIHVMAVRRTRHRTGLGRALLRTTERWLAMRGVRYLQVKTLSPSRNDAAYERTRAFYLAMGFTPLEEFPTLWSPENPCLQLVKSLAADAAPEPRPSHDRSDPPG